ncbi:MAG: FKBP-type peptidyl-prolyl cis-trans isomerase [Planctomycetota bacterium]
MSTSQLYDYAKNGDLVLFSYTGTRKGEFDGGFEKPTPQVTVIGAKADLVYDDAVKNIKLTNFRQ